MNPTHYLVVDLEATCDDGDAVPRAEAETIEIGALLVDAEGLEIAGELQTFVRPIVHPHLTEFCTRLTTITQAQVDTAPRFPEAIAMLRRFVDGKRVLFACWGDYDIHQLERDARRHGLRLPVGPEHLNVKAAFARRLGSHHRWGTGEALRQVGLRRVGTAHRGIDDARNVVRLLPWALGRRAFAGGGAA